MFDNTRPNIIILSDRTDTIVLTKTLGPYKVAHELRMAGYEVAVLHHLHIFTYDEIKDILSQMISPQTLFVGFNSSFYQNIADPIIDEKTKGTYYRPKELGSFLPHGKHYNKDLIQLIKGCNPKCQIVFGGPDATDAEYCSDYDWVIPGYADNSAIDLADHLLNGTKLDNMHRSIYGFKVINDSKAAGYDFVNTPMVYADHDCIIPGEILVHEISRGCIFNCLFCSYPLNGKKKLDYIKNEDILRNEFLDNYHRFGVTRYIFSDDTLNDSEEKIDMLVRVAKSLPFKLEYWAYIRLDLLAAHLHTADKLFESGCRGWYFGVETMNPESAKIIGKGGSREKLFNAAKYVKNKYGNAVVLQGSFIYGLPRESVESLEETTRMLLDPNSPFDTYFAYHLRIGVPRLNGFNSELEMNPEKYGYKLLGVRDGFRLWENEHMNLEKATEMANYVNKFGEESSLRKINASGVFNIAGLGYDLEFSANKAVGDMDWYSLWKRKIERGDRYKQLIREKWNLKS